MRKLKFSLIEVLVTLVVFSIVMGLAMMSFSYFDENWHKISRSEARMGKSFRQYFLLQASFESCVDYYALASLKEGKKGHQLLFEGEPNRVTWVSLRSFFDGQGAALCRLSISEKESRALVYEEVSLKKEYILSHSQVNSLFNQSGVKRASWAIPEGGNASFEYFAFVDSLAFLKGEKTWQKSYSGKEFNLLPLKVRLDIHAETKKQFLFNLPAGNDGRYLFYSQIEGAR